MTALTQAGRAVVFWAVVVAAPLGAQAPFTLPDDNAHPITLAEAIDGDEADFRTLAGLSQVRASHPAGLLVRHFAGPILRRAGLAAA